MKPKDLKTQLPISVVLKHYGAECVNVGNGSWYCPIHEKGGKEEGHKTPSLVAKDEKGTATCLSQGDFQSDDIFGVIAKMEHLDLTTKFREILAKAHSIAGILSEQFSPKPSVFNRPDNWKILSSPPQEELQEQHYLYLESQGIHRETAKLFQLKSHKNYILYPHIKNEKLVAYKGISITKDPKTGKSKSFSDGKDKTCKLWYEPIFRQQKTLIFVEGEKDCMRITQELFSLGIEDRIMALTSSAGARSFPPDIRNLFQQNKIELVWILYDNDKSGREGSEKLAQAITTMDVKVKCLQFPESFKKGYDVTDWFQENRSLNGLFELPYTTPPSPLEIFREKRKDLLINTDKFFGLTLIPDQILTTGFSKIDNECPVVIGQNTIITGRTGYGKTVLAVNIVNGILKNNRDAKVLFFSLELTKKALFHRLVACEYDLIKWNIERGFIGKNLNFLDGKEAYIKSGQEYIKNYGEKLLISDGISFFEEIEEIVQEAKGCGFGPNCIIIDYVNILDFKTPIQEENKHIGISKSIKKFAKKENIHIIAVCQANRMTTEKSDSFARTENLADSDQYGRDAFVVYSIKSEEETFSINPTKNRNGQAEQTFDFKWNPKSGKIFKKTNASIGSDFSNGDLYGN